jgi:hypothetical protein
MIMSTRASRISRFGVYVGVALCLSIASAVGTSSSSAQDDKAGWVNTLAGNDLSKHWTTKGNWKINDEGVVALEPRPGEKGWTRYDAYLWLNDKYKDFEIEFDYKVQPRGNSGFYFNVADKADPVAKGIEVQIYDAPAKGNDAKLTDHDSGGIIPRIPPTKGAGKPAGEWNRMQVTRKGNNVTVKLNGETVNEVKLDDPRLKGRPESGYIGFQDHGLPLALRNIRIRKLSGE